ncbi:D-glycero-alpha-D-manno-heptose-1,7-bisphosphate 7-phosphatase [Salinicoccus sp. HZC-1]|uniref:D-glycero-alpha-D-manno-heptose-1,7-bisphosphate 7-phosphatase n=1 Tax=Salinicoccus sp. HZC-1 TaxID=3385497 RepID=UPI00398AA8B7
MNMAVFLDRDGVINEVLSERVKFVNTAEDFHLLPGAGEGIKKLNDAGYKVYVVTNQGGIGLGYMSEEALEAVHQEMEEQLAGFDAVIDSIAYCPHMPQSGCRCRKPKPGMLMDLAKKHGIDLSGSYMAGDREPDIEAGRNAGTKTIFIGKDKKQKVKADKNFPNLLSFADWLTE